MNPSLTQTKSPWRRFVGWTIAGILVLSLVLVLFKGGQIALDGWRAYHNGIALVEALREDRSPATLLAHQAELSATAAALAALEDDVAPLAPFLRRLDGLTVYGSTLAYTPEFLTIAAELSQVAAEGVALVAPAIPANAEGDAFVQAALAAISGQYDAFAPLADRAAVAGNALASIDASALHPALAGPLAEIQPFAEYLGPALQIAPGLPDLLGMNGPYTYLVLLQNNHELRGTGGFITGVGRVTVERGRVTELHFSDSYAVDNHTVDHPPAPAVLQKYMQADLLFLRDANWSPDLPISARIIDTLYTRDTGQKVDGIVTMDLAAVELIVGAVGPVTVPGLDEPVTGQNVVDLIKQLWANPLGDGATVTDNRGEWFQQRKDFLPTIAGAILEKLKSGRFNPFAVAGAGRQALNQRAIQVWVQDARVREQLHRWGWDGGLLPPQDADFLALVDSNLGFNKVDSVLERSLDYQVSWPDGPQSPGVARATVTYRHPIDLPAHECLLTPRYGDRYDEMAERCYYDYVRLYVPSGSELLGIDGVKADSVSSKRGEVGTQVFGGYFVMKPGTTHQVTFLYRLPARIQRQGYRLVIQRQSGTPPLPLRWQIGNRAFTYIHSLNTFVWTDK
ncbi:MAG: DUF4012 domain-containing protein [Caldilineaceae bacterium]